MADETKKKDAAVKAIKLKKGGKKEEVSSDSDEPLNDKFDPSRRRKGKLGLKTEGNKQ
jgi:hypothetical protein